MTVSHWHGQWLGQQRRFAKNKPGKTVLLLADNTKVSIEVEAMA